MKNKDKTNKIENRSEEKDIEIRLKAEIEKWTKKIEEELRNFSKENKKEILKNIKAYIEDSKYFYNKGDLVRAFEAIIWAWALFEINFGREEYTT